MHAVLSARSSILFAGALVALLGLVGVARARTQERRPWIHIEVAGEEDDRVNVNLPLAAVQAALALAPDSVVSDGRVRLGAEGVSVSELRQLWQAILAGGDAQLVTVNSEDEQVGVVRRGDTLEVSVDGRDGDENVRARVPVALVDALLSGEGDALNLEAAVSRLGDLRGDIVQVDEGPKRIRVWVDETP